MATTFTDIRAALEARLAAHQATNVDYENSTYTPTSGTAWLRAVLKMDAPTPAGVGDNAQNLQRGIFQIDALHPVAAGASAAQAKADGLVTHFKRGTELTSGTVTLTTDNAWPGESHEETVNAINWFVIPVTVSFQAFTTNV